MIAWLVIFALFVLVLAGLAAVADWMGEPKRSDSRRRNR